MLKFKLNVAERKTLAKRMEELTGIHPYYTKAPFLQPSDGFNRPEPSGCETGRCGSETH